MIPFDLEFYVPENIEEASGLFAKLADEGKEPLYYAGGTEIITFTRQQIIKPDSLIDLKKIPETTTLKLEGEKLTIGSNITLTTLQGQEYFPLLALTAGVIADRTVRNRLTLGGNICGKLPYREAILALLIADTKTVLAGTEGMRTVPLSELFEKRLKLKKGEFLVQLIVPGDQLKNKSWAKRREKHGRVDYPLCHTAVMQKKGLISAAVSGLCAFPFHSSQIDEVLNDTSLAPEKRAEKASELLPAAVRSDELGSADYRLELWKKDLVTMLSELEGAG